MGSTPATTPGGHAPRRPRRAGHSLEAAQEPTVRISLRSVAAAVGLVLAVVVAAKLVLLARSGLTLVAIAALVALALNPAVGAFERLGLRRGWAVAAVSVLAATVVASVAVVLIPPLADQIGRFVDALPNLVADLTRGRGPLGFLETKYHVVERVRRATSQGTALQREATSAVSALRGIASTLVEVVIIAFLALFMLLEGPDWRRRAVALTPARHRPAVERVGAGVYRCITGFVTGNLLASLLAAVVATVMMLVAGVPYALPLGLFVGIVELVPVIGPTVATLVVTAVALTRGTGTALAVFALLAAYHAVEAHTIRPLLYGRAVALSPLTVLIAIVLGTDVAGILGAVMAIPVAGSLGAVLRELLAQPRGEQPARRVRAGRQGRERASPGAAP
jgi:predicted PurR-regulated permease PerM